MTKSTGKSEGRTETGCKCIEGIIDSGRTTAHNCAYIRSRNALIGQAEFIANREAGPKVKETANDKTKHMVWSARWTRLFHDTMNQLYAESQKPKV